MGIFSQFRNSSNVPRCSICGRFISYEDLREGIAIWEMVLPDSDLSSETWEGECKNCYIPREHHEHNLRGLR